MRKTGGTMQEIKLGRRQYSLLEEILAAAGLGLLAAVCLYALHLA